MRTIHSFLENSATRLPDKEALISGERRLTYSEVNRIANRIRDFVCTKTGKQDAVAILLDNSIEFVASYFGILKAGCVAVPMDVNSSDQSLLFKARDSGAKLIISGRKFLDKLKRSGVLEFAECSDCEKIPECPHAERHVSENDLSAILYTSGTTGEPKGVMIRHRNVVAATDNIVQLIGITENDIDVNALPYTHSFGLGHIHCYFRQGGTIVIQRNFINLNELLEKVIKERATSFSSPPAILKLLVENYSCRLSECAKNLRYIVTNTNFMPKETSLPFMGMLGETRVYMYYGLTEASRSSFNLLNENMEKVESVGRPAPNVEIRIVDDGMKDIPANQMGEIIIRGRHVVDGYWKRLEETEKSIVNSWLRTGDMGYFDEEGYLWLVGRKDHMINVAGQKVSPLEIEKIASGFPGIRECAAVGCRDDVLNEVVKLFVVGEGSGEEIMRFCRARLENFKVPRYVEFVESLPKTEAGKIRRSFLR
ncbi:MAG TPA: class I adenylate-forming enzyme family protein [archaeon]|nr:class I adenylate-forming enzyme family protein [archaeon]